MILEIFPSGPLSTNAILLGCEQTKKAACIDPSMGSFDFFQKELKKNDLEPIAILLTHSHWDHIADVAKLKEKYSIPVYVHELDVANLEKPGADGIPLMVPIESAVADHTFKDGDHISIGSLDIQVIHTPGHSKGSVCFYLKKEKILLSGDTIFKRSIGNVSFPFSEPTKMWESCKILSELPPDTRVIPGHGPETRIGLESWLKDAQHYFS